MSKFTVRISTSGEELFFEHFPDRASATSAAYDYISRGYLRQLGSDFILYPPQRITLVEIYPVG